MKSVFYFRPQKCLPSKVCANDITRRPNKLLVELNKLQMEHWLRWGCVLMVKRDTFSPGEGTCLQTQRQPALEVSARHKQSWSGYFDAKDPNRRDSPGICPDSKGAVRR